MKTSIRSGIGKSVPVTFAVALLGGISLLLSPRLDARTDPASGAPAIAAAHLLSVQVSGDGAGSVTSDPSGIDCHDRCSARFAADGDTTVTLTATTGSVGSVFIGWTGACDGIAPGCTVTMDAAKSVEAVFADIGDTVQAVSAGYYHTCVLTSAGAVWCWGRNNYGQLGDGTQTDRSMPVAVSGLSSGVQSIRVGYYHTCASTSAGAVRCWGNNSNGQLGDGTTTQRLTPVPVSGLSSGVQAISAGEYHACALTAAGAMWCWGYNLHGRLGDGTTTQRLTPVQVSGLSSGVLAISAGGNHTCAVIGSGAARCWGYNVFGQLGDGTTTSRSTPVAVSGLSSGVQTISAGDVHTCALTGAGAVQCWGNNTYGQIGDGTVTNRSTPVAVSGLSSGVQAIGSGHDHTCALTSPGALWCWGYNLYGRLGDGTQTDRSTPVPVSGLSSGVAGIGTGGLHSCASTSAGAAWCWGWNGYGQIGDGTTTYRLTPVRVIDPPDLVFRNGFE